MSFTSATRAISGPVVPAQRDPVFSTNPFQSASCEGVGLARLREITQRLTLRLIGKLPINGAEVSPGELHSMADGQSCSNNGRAARRLLVFRCS